MMCLAACSCPEPATADRPPHSHPPPDRVHEPGHRGEHHGAHHDSPSPLGHRFERADEWVPIFEGPDREASQKPALVVTTMALEAGMTVADIGTGTGYFLRHLS